MGDLKNTYKHLVSKPKRKEPFGRSRHKWEDKIRMDLREVG
jgi:hypothetical protein